MTSYPLGKIRCTSCGGFINRKYGAYRRLIGMGYSKVKAFEALNVPRYCCRAHLENPDIMTLSITGREEEAILEGLEGEFGKEDAETMTEKVLFEMLSIDPLDEHDKTSLVNDEKVEKMITSVLEGTFKTSLRGKLEPVLKVSNEEISRAKRENKSAKVGEGEPIYNRKTGERVGRRPLPIIVKPVRPQTKTITAKGSLFAVGYRGPRRGVPKGKERGDFKGEKRAAVRRVEEEEEEGEDIYEVMGPRGKPLERKVKVKELSEREMVPEGYAEALIKKPQYVPEEPIPETPGPKPRLVLK